ncbi:hypothetical protein QQF64_026316 [Cirrhinus molitorella]|uniref:Secreted protein n=1 Tax=Cirrhinus molitorella TaxID=172907 RepID=A0ABR3N9G9_9TELE
MPFLFLLFVFVSLPAAEPQRLHSIECLWLYLSRSSEKSASVPFVKAECPSVSSRDIVKHAEAPTFPTLPLDGYRLEGRFKFVPNYHRMWFLESLAVTQELSTIIEADTRDQSQSPLWNQMRRPRITSSRFM